MSSFGERYREAWARWRAAHPEAGENETRFAEALGVGMSSLSPYKNQIAAPIHERVLLIARVAGVDPGWLAYGSASLAPAPGLEGARAAMEAMQDRIVELNEADVRAAIAARKASAPQGRGAIVNQADLKALEDSQAEEEAAKRAAEGRGRKRRA